MTGTQYQNLLGAIQRSAEETRLYVDQSVQRSAEETRRHVEESVQRSAEETRRYVDESVQRSAEETRRYVDESVQHSAEETRRYVDETVRRSAEETRKYVDRSVQDSAEETRRLSGISDEQLRSEIQLVAEGVSGLSTRIEAVRQEVGAEIAETRAQMKIYFGHLDRRVTALEGSVGDLSVRFDRFEASSAR